MNAPTKIRPGIRAAFDPLSYPQREPGIVGVFIGDDERLVEFQEGRGGRTYVYTKYLTPVPFEPGDRVENSYTGKIGTVVNTPAISGYTYLCYDGCTSCENVWTDSLTLIDYPGKRAQGGGE